MLDRTTALVLAWTILILMIIRLFLLRSRIHRAPNPRVRLNAQIALTHWAFLFIGLILVGSLALLVPKLRAGDRESLYLAIFGTLFAAYTLYRVHLIRRTLTEARNKLDRF